MTRIILVAAACLAMAACAEGPQRSLATRKLDSGIIADDGGGMTQLHNTPNVGITNGTTTVTGLHNKAQQ